MGESFSWKHALFWQVNFTYPGVKTSKTIWNKPDKGLYIQATGKTEELWMEKKRTHSLVTNMSEVHIWESVKICTGRERRHFQQFFHFKPTWRIQNCPKKNKITLKWKSQKQFCCLRASYNASLQDDPCY